MANVKAGEKRGWGQVIQVCQWSARLHICGRRSYYIEEDGEGGLVWGKWRSGAKVCLQQQ